MPASPSLSSSTSMVIFDLSSLNTTTDVSGRDELVDFLKTFDQ